MPIFEYECTDCGERVEHLQLSSDAPLAECPECGGAVRKLMSAPAFQFKGTGWYVTDYAGKGKPSSNGGGSASSSTDKKADKEGSKTAKSSDSDGSKSGSSSVSPAKPSATSD